ncbi:hypothetical protein HON36_03520 [Candidatus Parcubacteria bacterium]|nr:hypothetical protein [Candidatus Parcubacteria bacterium]MBT7228354.1 hypothetical protein [Candidatus Parcubacteria bacterium]
MSGEEKISAWFDSALSYMGSHWFSIFVVPILALIALSIFCSSNRSTKTQASGLIGTLLVTALWYLRDIISVDLSVGSIVTAVLVTVLYFSIGYKAYQPRDWFVTFQKSKPVRIDKVYLNLSITHLVSWLSAMGAIMSGFNKLFVLVACILVPGMYILSLLHSVPLRQIWIPTVFNKPWTSWAMKTGLNFFWAWSTWFTFVDIIPVSVAKREEKYKTGELPSKAMSNEGGKEAVAAGTKFKIEYREVHKMDPGHSEYPRNLDIFLEMDDDERNNIDEYIRRVIEDWMADYLNSQEASDILDETFMREIKNLPVNFDAYRTSRRVSDDVDSQEYKDALEAYEIQRKINDAIKDLKKKVLDETGHTLEVIGIIDRTPDKNFEKAMEDYATKNAEEQTALRDINVQTAKGKAFMAYLGTIRTTINRTRAAGEKLTVDDVWQLVIEHERAGKAASHVIGVGPLGSALSRFASTKLT